MLSEALALLASADADAGMLTATILALPRVGARTSYSLASQSLAATSSFVLGHLGL